MERKMLFLVAGFRIAFHAAFLSRNSYRANIGRPFFAVITTPSIACAALCGMNSKSLPGTGVADGRRTWHGC